METIGKRIKKYREDKRMTQSDLSEEMKKLGFSFSQSYISKIEKDDREIDIRQLKSLAKVLGVHELQLLYSEEELKDIDLSLLK